MGFKQVLFRRSELQDAVRLVEDGDRIELLTLIAGSTLLDVRSEGDWVVFDVDEPSAEHLTVSVGIAGEEN